MVSLKREEEESWKAVAIKEEPVTPSKENR